MRLRARTVGQRMLSQVDGLSQLAVMRCLRTAVRIKQSQQLDAERTHETDIASTGQTETRRSMPKRPAAAMEAAPAGPVPLRSRPAAAMAAVVGAAVAQGAAVRRRLRGKQPAADYLDRPHAEPAAPVDDGPRGRKPSKNCKGQSNGTSCKFAADGSGAPARGHHDGRCAFCDPAAMTKAMGKAHGRKMVLRSLKVWRQRAPHIFEEAFTESTLAGLAPEVVQRLRNEAEEPSYEETLARRASVLAEPTPREDQQYKEAVAQDRAYAQKKFFPKRKRAVRHAGYEWSNPMPEEVREKVQDLLPNDTGLPAASVSPASTSLEHWCKKLSWGVCKFCASVQPNHLKETALQSTSTESLVRCKNCAKAEPKQAWIPQPNDVPEPLRGLTRQELEALRPLDIDCGPAWKAEFGYYFHSAMVRFSWAETDVEDKINALERRSRKRTKKAGRRKENQGCNANIDRHKLCD